MRDVFAVESNTAIRGDDPYVAAYPHLLAYFSSIKEIKDTHVVCAAHMAYGWMPTILELRPRVANLDLHVAAVLLQKARAGICLSTSDLRSLSRLINNSVVGASKLLHFAAPQTYPIWDANVYSFVHEKRPYSYRVNSVETYQEYLALLGELTKQAYFPAFHASVNRKVGYVVSTLRALELIMFLNAPDFGQQIGDQSG